MNFCYGHNSFNLLTVYTMLIDLVSKNIRHYRKICGISQEELAYRAGLHRTYIGSVERGERNLSLLNLELIAKALGVSPAQLFAINDDYK